MAKQRVCLLFNVEIYNKLRGVQADQIKKTKSNVSLSQLVEDLVKHGIDSRVERL